MTNRPGVPEEARTLPQTEGGADNAHLKGIGLFLAAILLINASDVSAKLSIDIVTGFQMTFCQTIGFLLVCFIAARSVNAPRILKTPHWKLHLLRSVCILLSALAYFKGLEVLDLADIISIILLGPLLVTMLAAVVLKEQVGPRRWAACIVGFAGAMLIIRPGFDGLGTAALWPIACVSLYAIHVVATRHLSATDSTPTIILWSPLVGFVVLGAAVPFYWVWPDAETWMGLVAVAVFSGISNGLRIKSLSYAPASVLAPFGYAEIVGGTAAGLLIFGTFPDGLSWAGIAVIVSAGLYVWHRERLRAAA